MTKAREVYSEPQKATANKNITHISKFGEKPNVTKQHTYINICIYEYMYIHIYTHIYIYIYIFDILQYFELHVANFHNIL